MGQGDRRHVLAYLRQFETLRFSCAVAIFPVIGHARVTKDESDQIFETSLRANIVREDYDTTLTGFDAYHCVRSLTVVAAFEESSELWGEWRL